MSSDDERSPITVFLRCKPSNQNNDFLDISLANNTLEVSIPDDRSQDNFGGERLRKSTFEFHGIFDENSTQEDVFEVLAQDCMSSVIDGVNATIFAYGQSGAGKTYTMYGPSYGHSPEQTNGDETSGILPRVLQQLFTTVNVVRDSPKESHDLSRMSISNIVTEAKVSISFLEICNGSGRDLLHDEAIEKLNKRPSLESSSHCGKAKT